MANPMPIPASRLPWGVCTRGSVCTRCVHVCSYTCVYNVDTRHPTSCVGVCGGGQRWGEEAGVRDVCGSAGMDMLSHMLCHVCTPHQTNCSHTRMPKGLPALYTLSTRFLHTSTRLSTRTGEIDSDECGPDDEELYNMHPLVLEHGASRA